jgi:hypothetical protein
MLQSRHAALAELGGDLGAAEAGYENAMWLLLALLDEAMYDTGTIKDEDRIGVEKGMFAIAHLIRHDLLADPEQCLHRSVRDST